MTVEAVWSDNLGKSTSNEFKKLANRLLLQFWLYVYLSQIWFVGYMISKRIYDHGNSWIRSCLSKRLSDHLASFDFQELLLEDEPLKELLPMSRKDSNFIRFNEFVWMTNRKLSQTIYDSPADVTSLKQRKQIWEENDVEKRHILNVLNETILPVNLHFEEVARHISSGFIEFDKSCWQLKLTIL